MMFHIIDSQKGCAPIKSGFKDAASANKWAKKNLPPDEVCLHGVKYDLSKCHGFRYFVNMKPKKMRWQK